MGTVFWMLANNEEIYAHMSRAPLGCVGTLVFKKMVPDKHVESKCLPSSHHGAIQVEETGKESADPEQVLQTLE